MNLRNEIKETKECLELSYSWYEDYHKGALLFFVVWDIINLILWYPMYMPLLRGDFAFPKNLFAFCTLFMLIPAPSYWLLTYLINSTRVFLSNSEVKIIHGPLPSWRRNQTIAIKDIRYIQVEELSRPAEELVAWNIIVDKACHVIAVMRSGESRPIFFYIQDPNEALDARNRMGSWLRLQMMKQLETPKEAT